MIYQGLYLTPGRYNLSWDGTGELSPVVRSVDGNESTVNTDGVFVITRPQTAIIGLKGRNATVSNVSVSKSNVNNTNL